MYNTDMPTRAELPSSQQLIKSTAIAVAVAATLLITIVLPSEYAIDPTGIGRALGMTKMGEIKTQLAQEAAKDAQVVSAASAQTASEVTSTAAADVTGSVLPVAARTDTMQVMLKPDEGTEIKLTMNKGDRVAFNWKVQGGVVNYDTHGDQGEAIKYHGYGKGKGSAGEAGMLEAAFDGHHGFYWRNRGSEAVTVTLETRGSYTDIKKMM
jgi:hypothetical protein